MIRRFWDWLFRRRRKKVEEVLEDVFIPNRKMRRDMRRDMRLKGPGYTRSYRKGRTQRGSG